MGVPCQVPVDMVPIDEREDSVCTPVVATLVPTLNTRPAVPDADTVMRLGVPHKVSAPLRELREDTLWEYAVS